MSTGASKGSGFQDEKDKVRGVVDMVLCLDVTQSMSPCLEALKGNLAGFIAELKKPREADVQTIVAVQDWRARIIPYRDIKCDGPGGMINDMPWVANDAEVLKGQFSDPRAQASGGGDEPESTLDAIYNASRSEWRAGKVARFVIVFTDATTHEALEAATVGVGTPATIDWLQQQINEHKVKLFIYGPECEAYRALVDKQVKEVKETSKLLPTRNDALEFFQNASKNLEPLLTRLAASISRESSKVK